MSLHVQQLDGQTMFAEGPQRAVPPAVQQAQTVGRTAAMTSVAPPKWPPTKASPWVTSRLCRV